MRVRPKILFIVKNARNVVHRRIHSPEDSYQYRPQLYQKPFNPEYSKENGSINLA